MPRVNVDYNQCDRVVDFLRKYNIPEDKEDSSSVTLPDDVTKNFYFLLVSICHQTTPLVGPSLNGYINGTFYKGFDYLRNKLLDATAKDNSLVYPERMSAITGQEIIELLRDEKGKSDISDPEGRAALLNDMGKKMKALNYGSVQDLYDLSGGFLEREDGGLYGLLAQFEAFSDPVKKKSSYFLSIMKNNSFWAYKDDENLMPPVDYHETRIALRMGTVKIEDNSLKDKIMRREEIGQEDDIEIRRNLMEAMTYIANKAGITHSRLHYFLWNLARNCCGRDSPHCGSCGDDCKLPDRYSNLKKEMEIDKCMLNDMCESSYSAEKLVEHKVKTHFY